MVSLTMRNSGDAFVSAGAEAVRQILPQRWCRSSTTNTSSTFCMEAEAGSAFQSRVATSIVEQGLSLEHFGVLHFAKYNDMISGWNS